MLSAGYCLLPVDLRVIAANTSVRPPTRPVYIDMINTIFDKVCRVGVRPIERPPVPTADALSNKDLKNAWFSNLAINIAPKIAIVKGTNAPFFFLKQTMAFHL